MADEEEFDIYGDYDFGQADDILDEIVNDNPTPKKRPRPIVKEPEPDKPSKALKTEKEQPQKIQTTTQTYQSTVQTDPKSLPYTITQLRGITSKPTHCIYLGELHWYTTDKEVKEPLKKANLLNDIKEMTFYEHKINGKSKGIVFFEFTNKDSASQAKLIFDKTEFDHKKVYAVYTTSLNPFKHLSKETNTGKSTRNTNANRINNNVPGMMPTNYNAAAAAAAAAAMAGFMPSYGFPVRNNVNYNRNTMVRNQQPYSNTRNNRNNNDGFSGGMYINPAFFDNNYKK